MWNVNLVTRRRRGASTFWSGERTIKERPSAQLKAIVIIIAASYFVAHSHAITSLVFCYVVTTYLAGGARFY